MPQQAPPRWRSSLTSVNTYLLQAVNYVEYFANSGGKSTACFGTSETLAPSGVNNPKYNKELNETIFNRVNGELYNRDAINKLREGKLPGEALDNKTKLPVEGKIGVPRNMPSSKDPDAMAINFAEQFLGRKITPEEWESGKNVFKGKDCINCFRVDLENGGVIIYRSGISNNSSDRTLAGTASLDINIPEVNKYNKDTMLKLKFPKEE